MSKKREFSILVISGGDEDKDRVGGDGDDEKERTGTRCDTTAKKRCVVDDVLKKEELQNSGLITTIELQQKLLYEAIVNDNICELERLLIEAPIDIITPLDLYKKEIVRLLIERERGGAVLNKV